MKKLQYNDKICVDLRNNKFCKHHGNHKHCSGIIGHVMNSNDHVLKIAIDDFYGLKYKKSIKFIKL